MVNCMPVFIAKGGHYQRRFEDAGLPIIGDDIKSQVGATITHRILTTLFRERGVRMSDLLLGHLDTTRAVGRDQLIAQAETLGREYGVEARRHGLSLGEGTQAFLFFRARFMAEIANVARRRSLASEQAALLFEEADRALDRVILACPRAEPAKRLSASEVAVAVDPFERAFDVLPQSFEELPVMGFQVWYCSTACEACNG